METKSIKQEKIIKKRNALKNRIVVSLVELILVKTSKSEVGRILERSCMIEKDILQ